MRAILERRWKRLEELVPKEEEVSVHTIHFIDSDGSVSGTMELRHQASHRPDKHWPKNRFSDRRRWA